MNLIVTSLLARAFIFPAYEEIPGAANLLHFLFFFLLLQIWRIHPLLPNSLCFPFLILGCSWREDHGWFAVDWGCEDFHSFLSQLDVVVFMERTVLFLSPFFFFCIPVHFSLYKTNYFHQPQHLSFKVSSKYFAVQGICHNLNDVSPSLLLCNRWLLSAQTLLSNDLLA